MSPLYMFLAFFIGGLCGIGVMGLMYAARDPFNYLTEEDIDRMWTASCMDVQGNTVATFARSVERHITQ